MIKLELTERQVSGIITLLKIEYMSSGGSYSDGIKTTMNKIKKQYKAQKDKK